MYKQLLCVSILLSAAHAAKILGVFLTPSYSHQIVYQPIWRELSLRGHEVTVYTPNPINDPTLTNLTEYDMSFAYEGFNNDTTKIYLSGASKGEEFRMLIEAYLNTFHTQMSSPEFQKLIANEDNAEYDLFLVEYLLPSVYPLKDVYKCPMVGIISLPLTVTSTEGMGMSKHPVLDPEFFLSFSSDLTFKERVISTLFQYIIKAKHYLTPVTEYTIASRQHFGKDSREVWSIAKEVSLVLGNTNLAIQNIRPTVPAFVGISGIHLRPPKPLPQGLKKLLDDAKQGVIYFSLGTNVKSHLLPKKRVQLLLSALSELPYKVLWRFETDDITDLPKNVEIRKWLPQQDVLRHKNVKLFITQGGLQSIDEGLNSTLPLLVVPFFGDQHFNAHKIVNAGAGLSLNFFDFTQEELIEKVHKLILDPTYKNTATKLAAIAADEPVPALEKAVFWIEYVLRHNGAPHLKYKAVDMPFYKYHLLDVHIFLASIVFLVSYVLLKIFKKIPIGYLFCRRALESAGISSTHSKKSQ